MLHHADVRQENLKKTGNLKHGWQEFRPRFEPGTLPIQVQVNLSLYRPRQAPRFPRG